MPIPAALISAGVPIVASAIGGLFGASASKRNAEASMDIAKFQASENQRLMDQYNAYNTPLAQRLRMEEAGYNPNLFYGQGNPGNQSSPLSYPDVKPRDYSFMNQIVPVVTQSALAQSQIVTQSTQRERSVAQTELAMVQKRVAEANPYLNQEAYNAIVDSFKSSAMIKANEATQSFYDTQVLTGQRPQDPSRMTVGQQIIVRQLELLDQKFQLQGKDLQIKAQIFNSQEFKNELLRIQTEFMKSGDITPGMILQFIQSVLLKAF